MASFSPELKYEYTHARRVLIEQASSPNTPAELKGAINYTLTTCTAKQVEIAIEAIETEFRAGYIIESKALNRKVPAYTGIDFSKVPKTHLNKITKDTIGHIGMFNIEVANRLKWEYAELLNDNIIINSLNEHGFTKRIEKRLIKAGVDTKAIELIKAQTTTNKMIKILEMHGIRGGMHPNSVAAELKPHIRAIFGEKGIKIDNIGSMQKRFFIDATGKHGWRDVKITRAFYSTTNNYADLVSRSSMLSTNRTGRFETLKQSKMVQSWRYESSMSANMCDMCGMMEGMILEDPTAYLDGLHARCACPGPRPIWKEGVGLTNRTDEYYNNRRDEWFWKKHKTNEYNKGLPKDERIPNYNYLPKDKLGVRPGQEEMQKIREGILK